MRQLIFWLLISLALLGCRNQVAQPTQQPTRTASPESSPLAPTRPASDPNQP
ncbi:MAG: hypothetical protein HC915_13415, partial [Anaerolineae bacterium]|nr:hypothetical protein [Anaerolineae bacterium]